MSKAKKIAQDAWKRAKIAIMGTTMAAIPTGSLNAQETMKTDGASTNNQELSLEDLKKFNLSDSTLVGAFDVKGNDEVAQEVLQPKERITTPVNQGQTVFITPSGYKFDIHANTETARYLDLGNMRKAVIEEGQYTVNGEKKSGIIGITIIQKKVGIGKYEVLSHLGLSEAQQAQTQGNYSLMSETANNLKTCAQNLADYDEGRQSFGEKKLGLVIKNMNKLSNETKKIQQEHQMFLITGENSALPSYEAGAQFSKIKRVNVNLAMSNSENNL